MSARHSLLAAASVLAIAVSLPAAAAFKIGSGNTVVITPPVDVPNETPCAVPLVTHAVFGADNVYYSYTPPAACPGPWAKVVLHVDVALQKGIQYDRTGTLWMAGVPLWFGTTAEPDPQLGPKWHFERDLTDYSALFKTPQTGFELIGNYTNSQDNSLITSTASIDFYPATTSFPAPATPDLVLPVSATGGGTVTLNTPSDTLSTTVTLPTNVKTATLALYLQGQSMDEFWYTCLPNDIAGEFDDCGNGALREGEITVDGTPAGVAPVYPWIFTGGIDPYLWAPLPGVQTLSFVPFNVPLSPFAGVLSSGAPHRIAVSVFGADSYFSAAGALFVTLDPKSAGITGSILHNSLAAAPTVNTIPNITSNADGASGTVDTAATHNFTIVGQSNTAAGTVINSVTETMAFRNIQALSETASTYVQNITQTTQTDVDVKYTSSSGATSEAHSTYAYPLTLKYHESVNAKGQGIQVTTVNQQHQTSRVNALQGQPTAQTSTAAATSATDKLGFANGYITGHSNQASTATLLMDGTNEHCFSRTLKAVNNVLTAETTGCLK